MTKAEVDDRSMKYICEIKQMRMRLLPTEIAELQTLVAVGEYIEAIRSDGFPEDGFEAYLIRRDQLDI